MSSVAESIADQDSQNCEAAEKFSKLYYENYDHDRKRVKEMYSKSACLVWNGNASQGQAAIGQFLEDLPPVTHQIRTLDAQTVSQKYTENRGALLLSVGGTVKQHGRILPFAQSFLLVVEEAKWRIVMDRFRYLGN